MSELLAPIKNAINLLDNNLNQKDLIKKRGPGRPPKVRQINDVTKNQGIVDTPFNKQNTMELIYNKPEVFKNLFIYFKNLKTKMLLIRCDKKGLTFFTQDQSGISKIIVKISGDKTTHYFCAADCWIIINRQHVEKVFSSIDKSVDEIIMTFNTDNNEYVNIIFIDKELDKECTYQINTSYQIPDPELIALEQYILSDMEIAKHFPLRWVLTSKQFKKTFNDAVSNKAEKISIEKYKGAPLKLSYTKIHQMIYSEVYKSSGKIELETTGSPNLLVFQVKTYNLRSLAAAMITNKVSLLCRDDGDVLVESSDEDVKIYTFVKGS
uniref:Uncharacterized protein E301R n=1 Tax=Abalone asfa-like virus TaxID=2839893 RepID=A0A5K7Y3L2_9VIRU|nr:E301R homolog protein [Abalone asfa-like virus]BCY04612.1 hypothetical protein [Abalone asfa-like virus]